jgi:glycosyltransferase involved in cell wall biosynthesis
MSGNDRWKVLSIELSESLSELRREPGYDGLYVVFYLNGRPLGHYWLSSEQLPLAPQHLANFAASAIAPSVGDRLLDEGFRSALPCLPEPALHEPKGALARLLELDRPMKQLGARPFECAGTTPCSVSVAVCTRERPRELARCLQSLLNLSEQPLEILVIDNAPLSEATRETVERFPGVRYHREPRAGLSAARNTAIAVASGDIVAFADDDVIVHPGWTARLRRCFQDSKVMAATGLVLPAELETRAQVIFEQDFQFFHQGFRARRFDSKYFAALLPKGVPVWTIGAGANMAVRRTAFAHGYRFDIRLGPGVFGGCGEDSEFWYHLLADGWSCLYEPSAVVHHFHRRDLNSLRRLVRQYMKGHVAALLLQFAKYRHPGNLRRILFALPAEYLLLLFRLALTGFSLDNRILFSGVLGCLSGLRLPLLSRRKQASAQ